MFVLMMLAILISSAVFRLLNPRLFWVFGLLALLLIHWTTTRAYAANWGVEKIGDTSGESIRQDSTQARTTFFGAYTRSHMGGGLMGGK